MASAEIVYFDRPGKHNTEELIQHVSESIGRTGIDTVVIASSTGETAIRAIESWSDRCKNIVVVTSHAGFTDEGMLEMDSETEQRIRKAGATVVRASHVLSGLERSFTRRFQGISRSEVVSETLRTLFGQGMKVCIEISIMAADSGAIVCGESEIIAVGGTGEGADTACVVRPSHASNFFKFEVREILAKPRSRGESGY